MQPINWIYALLWLLAVPAAAGMVLIKNTDKGKSICFAVVCGYAGLFAVAQILIISAIFLEASLTVVIWIYRIIALLWAAVGLVLNFRNLREKIVGIFRGRETVKISERFLFFTAILLIAVQMAVAALMVHHDADDSFYVAMASTSVYTDSIFQYNPYTGSIYKNLPSRYVLSPFPVYEAILTELVGVDVPYFVYTVFPVFMILLAYLVYGLWAELLFGTDRKQRALFLIFISVVQIFSNYSVYTAGTFLLLRIWQGKAVLAGILLPAVAYMCARLMGRRQKGRKVQESRGWPILFCLLLAACLVSSMGIILSMLMVGLYAFVCGVCARNWKVVGKALFCCMPNLIFAVIYIVIR